MVYFGKSSLARKGLFSLGSRLSQQESHLTSTARCMHATCSPWLPYFKNTPGTKIQWWRCPRSGFVFPHQSNWEPLTEHPDGRPPTRSHPGPGNATVKVTVKMKVHTGMFLPSLTPLRDPTLSLKVLADRACQNSQRHLQAAGPLRCVVSGPIGQPLGIETVRLTWEFSKLYFFLWRQRLTI